MAAQTTGKGVLIGGRAVTFCQHGLDEQQNQTDEKETAGGFQNGFNHLK